MPGNKATFIIVVSVLITTLFVGVASFIFGKSKQNNARGNTALPITQLAQIAPAVNNQTSENQESDVANDFVQSSYRVVAVLQNPLAPYSLIIATERSEAHCGNKDDPSRCVDDSTCGSIYTSPNCYFFVEPHFVAHADASTRFVGKWKGGLDRLNIDSIKFEDANNVLFNSAGADAGVSVQAVWNLDLKTGQVKRVSK